MSSRQLIQRFLHLAGGVMIGLSARCLYAAQEGLACRSSLSIKLIQVSKLLVRGNVCRVGGDKCFHLPNCLVGFSPAGIFQRKHVLGKTIVGILLKNLAEFGNAVGVHRLSIAPASAKSFSVRPPALCVESVSVTLFQRISMSG